MPIRKRDKPKISKEDALRFLNNKKNIEDNKVKEKNDTSSMLSLTCYFFFYLGMLILNHFENF
jgi:hypothetical protein